MKSVSKVALVAAALGFVFTTENVAAARNWSRTEHLRQHHGEHHQTRAAEEPAGSEGAAAHGASAEQTAKIEALEKEITKLKEELENANAAYEKAEARLDETEQHGALITDALAGLLSKKTIAGLDMRQYHKQLPVFEQAIKFVQGLVDEISAQEKEAEQNLSVPEKKEEAAKQLAALNHGVLQARNRMIHHVGPVLKAIVDAINKVK